MTLIRLPDPDPDVWVADTSVVLSATVPPLPDPVYGNFWPARPCRWRRHRWRVLLTTQRTSPRWRREVRRCQRRRCGAQVHQWWRVEPPERGRL